MGDRKPRGKRAPTDLALWDALAQDIEVASPPSCRTLQPKTTPTAHSGIADLYFVIGWKVASGLPCNRLPERSLSSSRSFQLTSAAVSIPHQRLELVRFHEQH